MSPRKHDVPDELLSRLLANYENSSGMRVVNADGGTRRLPCRVVLRT